MNSDLIYARDRLARQHYVPAKVIWVPVLMSVSVAMQRSLETTECICDGTLRRPRW